MAPSLARFREGVENKVIATRGAVEMTSLSNLTLPTPTTQDGRHTSGFQSHGAPAIIILVAAASGAYPAIAAGEVLRSVGLSSPTIVSRTT